MEHSSRLLRIGIFYDGNYFYHVSNYYCYAHSRRSRLSLPGLHDFIKHLIAKNESISPKFCQIVDSHYFRGRLPAKEANERELLFNERMFDDILMREGVVTHYLPLTRLGEKGVDVSLALEALELTIFKKFNVVVLIASDGDYLPLVRKLNSLGTRVMVLGWDFEYMDGNGNMRYTNTSVRLMNEVTYPVWMHSIINGTEKVYDLNIDSLFVPPSIHSAQKSEPVAQTQELQQPAAQQATPAPASMQDEPDIDDPQDEINGNIIHPQTGSAARKSGKIIQLKNGYGFISTDASAKNLFFFWEDLENTDFNELQVGDYLEYEPGINDRGECAKKIRLIT